MKKKFVSEDEFEIQDDIKSGSAEYYVEKAHFFWGVTEDLKDQKKISDGDYENSQKSFQKIMKIYEEYTAAEEKDKQKKKNDLVWAVAKYSSAVLYLEDGVDKQLLSW